MWQFTMSFSRQQVISSLTVTASGALLLYAGRRYWLNLTSSSKRKASKSRKRHPKIGKDFYRQLLGLLKIAFPGIWSREFFLLLCHTASLVCRTFLSIYVANLDGKIVKSIVEQDFRRFVVMVLRLLSVAIPATFINSLIRFLENKLALAIQTRLTRHAYQMYFHNQTYYKVTNLDTRLANPDHFLTEDLKNFSKAVAHIYSHVSKPLLDIIIMSMAMGRLFRKRGESMVGSAIFGWSVIAATATILRFISPPFGKLVAEEARRNGHLRYVHSRIITNAEEIAFYRGHEVNQDFCCWSMYQNFLPFKVELNLLQQSYRMLAQQMHIIFGKRLWYIMIEQFLMKYIWTVSGMVMVAIPLLLGNNKTPEEGVSERTKAFTTAKDLLVNGADAVERIMTSYKEVHT